MAENSLDRPLLVFDGECPFCRAWVDYWKRLTGDRIDYAPYQEVRFIPTGGINAKNLAEYLALPNVVACGGSWMATASMISEGQFDEIARLSRDAQAIVRQVRGESEVKR